MPLKAVTETIDDLSDELKALYVQDGERFILDMEDFREHPGLKPLTVALDRTQEDEKAAKRRAAELEARLKELEAKPNPSQKDDAEIQKIVSELKGEAESWKAKFEGLNSEIRERTIRDKVQAALAAGGVPEGMRLGAALAMLHDREVDVQDSDVVVKSVMGLETVDAFAKSWLAKDGKDYVAKPSGGGAGGSGGGVPSKVNPFKRGEHFNLTEQAKLLRTDPQLASQLKAEATE